MKNTNIKRPSRYAEDMDDDFPGREYLPYYERQLSRSIIEVVLDEPIREPAYYRNVLNRINNASEDDTVVLRLSGPGGAATTLQNFVNAIATTDAYIVGIVDGEIASAHSLIALACDELILMPVASLMLHQWSSGGFPGKAGETLAAVEFAHRHLHDLFSELCEGFLSEEEMIQMEMGKDFYFTRDEIEARLLARDAYREEKAKAEELTQQEPTPVVETTHKKAKPKK